LVTTFDVKNANERKNTDEKSIYYCTKDGLHVVRRDITNLPRKGNGPTLERNRRYNGEQIKLTKKGKEGVSDLGYQRKE